MQGKGVVRVSLSRVQAMQERESKMFFPPKNNVDTKKGDLLQGWIIVWVSLTTIALCYVMIYSIMGASSDQKSHFESRNTPSLNILEGE